jgi:hypothetical protein
LRQGITKKINMKTQGDITGEIQTGFFNTTSQYQVFEKNGLRIMIVGRINTDLEDINRLRLSLKIEQLVDEDFHLVLRDTLESLQTERIKVFVRRLRNCLLADHPLLEKTFNQFLLEVEAYFMSEVTRKRDKPPVINTLPEDRKNKTVQLLKQENLIETVYTMLTKVGVVGEKNNALLLFLTSLSRFQSNPISVILTSTKSDTAPLLTAVSDITSDEDLREIDAMTSNSISITPNKALHNKLLLGYDLKNMKKSMWALEALLTRKKIYKESVKKNARGYLEGLTYKVNGSIAFIGGCKDIRMIPSSIKEHSIMLQLEESKEQELLLLRHEGKKYAGTYSKDHQVIQQLKDMQTVLKNSSVTVINPFTEELIPEGNLSHKISIYQQILKVVEVITFLHQFQLKPDVTKDGECFITTTAEHVKLAVGLLGPVILNKEDSLTIKQRRFFNQCTAYCDKNQVTSFTNKQIQTEYGYGSRKVVNDYLRALDGYIQIENEDQKNGNTYTVTGDNREHESILKSIELLEAKSKSLLSVTVTPADSVVTLEPLSDTVLG